MSDKYKIRDKEKAYFITMTVVGWIDVFTRINHKLTIIESLKYCQKEKGLTIYGYCIMSSHSKLVIECLQVRVICNLELDVVVFNTHQEH